MTLTEKAIIIALIRGFRSTAAMLEKILKGKNEEKQAA